MDIKTAFSIMGGIIVFAVLLMPFFAIIEAWITSTPKKGKKDE